MERKIKKNFVLGVGKDHLRDMGYNIINIKKFGVLFVSFFDLAKVNKDKTRREKTYLRPYAKSTRCQVGDVLLLS